MRTAWSDAISSSDGAWAAGCARTFKSPPSHVSAAHGGAHPSQRAAHKRLCAPRACLSAPPCLGRFSFDDSSLTQTNRAAPSTHLLHAKAGCHLSLIFALRLAAALPPLRPQAALEAQQAAAHLAPVGARRGGPPPPLLRKPAQEPGTAGGKRFAQLTQAGADSMLVSCHASQPASSFQVPHSPGAAPGQWPHCCKHAAAACLHTHSAGWQGPHTSCELIMKDDGQPGGRPGCCCCCCCCCAASAASGGGSRPACCHNLAGNPRR